MTDRTELISLGRQAAADGTLKQLRSSQRLTTREAGAALGVDAATVSRWERGLSVPRGAAAERVGRWVAAGIGAS